MKFLPIKVVDIEISQVIPDFDALHAYQALKCLVRLHGKPLGYLQLPLHSGRCSASTIRAAILDTLGQTIMRALVNECLAAPLSTEALSIDLLLASKPRSFAGPFPLVTVAVCTRDRAANLPSCLDALCRLDYPALDLLVVDNAPSDQTTEQLVRTLYPNVRYICEPRPGLDWARNRAIIEANGEIVAYTDDDVIVDAGWASAIAHLFAEHQEVQAVTGLVVPYELETDAQILFEIYGGFGRGFERKWYRVGDEQSRSQHFHIGAGAFGTGANMAFRRSLFSAIGAFDPALDVGTVTNGGGDLELFFRVLQEGYLLVYEPAAVVRHRHRREYAQLRVQIANNGIGLFAYFVRSAWFYRRERKPIIRLALWWFWWWDIRRFLKSFVHPSRFPRDLVIAELLGCFQGLLRYPRARRAAARISRRFGPQVRTSPVPLVIAHPHATRHRIALLEPAVTNEESVAQ